MVSEFHFEARIRRKPTRSVASPSRFDSDDGEPAHQNSADATWKPRQAPLVSTVLAGDISGLDGTLASSHTLRADSARASRIGIANRVCKAASIVTLHSAEPMSRMPLRNNSPNAS